MQSLVGVLQSQIQNGTLPGREAQERFAHAHLIGHLQDKKGLSDFRRASEDVCPRWQQVFNDKWPGWEIGFHEFGHGKDAHFSKPLVCSLKSCYTICACKRGRLLPIWCDRWIRGSRFFILPHGRLRCFARSTPPACPLAPAAACRSAGWER